MSVSMERSWASRNPRVVKEEFVARALELRDLNPRGLLPKEFVDKIARRVFRLKKNQHHRYVGLCDPCSNSAINPNVKAETVYDLAQDGLAQTDWGSFALVNPPFRQTKVWANRAIAEADRGNNVILLTTTTRTTPEWSLEVRDRKFPVFVFDATQFSFLDYDRSAPFEIMIVCLSADEGVQCRFVETFIEDVLQRRGGFRQSLFVMLSHFLFCRLCSALCRSLLFSTPAVPCEAQHDEGKRRAPLLPDTSSPRERRRASLSPPSRAP